MSKQHATNPRAVREARHRQARMARAEKLEHKGEPRPRPVVVGACLGCSVELREGDEYEELRVIGPEPALLCVGCQVDSGS